MSGAGGAPAAVPATLATPRLRIRPLVLADAPFLFALLNDAGWLRFIGDKQVRSVADAERYLREGPLAMYAEHGIGLCAVEPLAGGAPLGVCGLLRRPGLDDVDIGYALLPAARGQGFAAETAAAVLAHAFGALGLLRVVAITDPENTASARVLAAIGLRPAGTVRLPHKATPLALWRAVRPG